MTQRHFRSRNQGGRPLNKGFLKKPGLRSGPVESLRRKGLGHNSRGLGVAEGCEQKRQLGAQEQSLQT